jgi:hypothetical protein
MNHATSWERAAEQLHTAAADVTGIAARRERAASELHISHNQAAPAMSMTGHSEDWMTAFSPAGNGRGFDLAAAHPARVYNYWLGGKDHFRADRKAAEEVMRLRPQVVASARANRAFLARVVQFLVTECGIRQFLDIGTGLPAAGNTHEVAQRAAPDCRVCYVDNDQLVLTHARALLGSITREGTCDYVDADLHEPETILAQAAHTLDFTEPAAVLLLAVVHFVPDAADPVGIVARLASALAGLVCGDLAPDRRLRARAGGRRHDRVQHPGAGAGHRPHPCPGHRVVRRAAPAGTGSGAHHRVAAPGRPAAPAR